MENPFGNAEKNDCRVRQIQRRFAEGFARLAPGYAGEAESGETREDTAEEAAFRPRFKRSRLKARFSHLASHLSEG